ncbi:alpha/beta hydrolase [Sulfitobacter sp. LCG007]
MNWLTLLPIAGLAVAALPLLLELRRRPVDAGMRKDAPGRFARLPQGVTHYQWSGPEDGPVAVCVHGLTTPGYVWRDVASGLAEMGYRVLVYDHIGRGFSDRAKARQDRNFFIAHLNALLAHEGMDEPITLLGYSMGGSVATAYAAAHPERIAALVLLASAGMGRVASGLDGVMLNTPLLGHWLMLSTYPRKLRAGIRAERALGQKGQDINRMQLAELDKRGLVPAVLSSQRGILSELMESDHLDIRNSGIPVLALWGREDDVIPLAASKVLASWNPDARQAIIDDAGHGLPYTHAEEVLARIRDFFRNAL